MLKPTNSAAEQIVALRSINGDIDTQIASLQSAQARNLDTITAFEEIATWEEVADEVPVVEEPVVVQEPIVVVTEPFVEVVTPEVLPDAEPAPVPTEDPAVMQASSPKRSSKKTK